MTPDDVPAAAAVGAAALGALMPADLEPADDAEREERVRRQRHRVGHLLKTDPDGAWVAELDGEVVGIALALVREDVWGLSLFGVKPGLQGQGIGGPILEGALRTAKGRRAAIILSSSDPRAMRRYFRAGFALRPAVAAAGAINRSRLPAGLRARPGDPGADRELLDATSRHVRTAAHGSDLLWSCLAAGPAGGAVHVDFVTQGNDWAVAVALDAGLALSPDGPMFTRGDIGPLAPYLPSGAYL